MEKGLLHKTRCYLSGHMEYADGTKWRDNTKNRLSKLDVTFLDPYHKPFATSLPEDEASRKALAVHKENGNYEYLNEYMRQVRSDDLRLCDIADFAIVHIIPSVASWGTAEELTTLNRQKKPIFLSVDGGKNQCPLWIFGMLNHKYIYSSLEDIYKVLEDIDSGAIAIDSTRWRLLNHNVR